MRIECSGPNGETFEAETSVGTGPYIIDKRQDEERQASDIQKALETWCRMIMDTAKLTKD